MSLEIVAISMFFVLVVFLFMGHPLAFVLGGVGFLYGIIFLGPSFIGLFMDRIVGQQNNFVLVAITLFILMGNFLTESGVADGLFGSMRYLFGPLRGGLGIAVIIVCILFAACTGIVGASVVTMGMLGAPVLLRYGYSKELTMGMIAAGGSLGILIPPSIMLVIMGDQAGLSVGKLLLGAFIPGVSLGIIYIIYIAVACYINPKLGPAVPAAELAKMPVKKRITGALINALPPLALIFAVLGSIFSGIATPTEASGVGAFMAFLMMIAYGKFSWKTLLKIMVQTGKTTTMVMVILIGATCFTAVFLGLGGGSTMVNALMGLSSSKWVIYSIMMIILIILGCFIDWVGIVLIVLPIFMPVSAALGFDPIWFVMMMAVNLQMSFLTPPFGYALFYLASMKFEGVTVSHIYRGVVPFLILQGIGLIICTAFPILTLWLPSLMRK
jgi:tripartite ATP-independent transporter DctM subunit